MNLELNELALTLVEEILESPDHYRVIQHGSEGSGILIDFGVEAEGSLEAGQALATIALAGLAEVGLTHGQLEGMPWPHVCVETDYPVAACLFSQYAGWQLSHGKFFAMGSGPMRAAAASEPLFDKLWYKEETDQVVGVLETPRLPGPEIFEMIAEKASVAPADVTLLCAPTSSIAGNYQVVARSIETALHKLYELGFDVHRVRNGWGSTPLAPVAANDLQGIGRTNDAILYGSSVTLYVTGDDDTIVDVLQKIPSSSSPTYGQPFLDIFEAAHRDFYKIDPMLFSPAQVIFQNLDTGRVHIAGKLAPEILRRSFGF